MNISKKKLTGFAAGAMAVALVAGAWAYYTSTAAIDNNLQTKSYGDRTVEEFTPDQEIQPGSNITKAVGVENTGAYNLVVRIKMDEKWTRTPTGATSPTTIIEHSSIKDAATTHTSNPAFSSVVNAAPLYTATQTDAADGLTAGDETVMYKDLNLAATGATGWVDGGDGYWYYNAMLEPGKFTGDLLKSLTMATNADMGFYAGAVEMYSTTPKATIDPLKTAYAANPTAANLAALEAAYAWTKTKPTDVTTITYINSENAIDPAKGGYADANYTLTITTEVCQATKDAVTATWTAGTVPAALVALLPQK
ncbi:MAG: BsaA family SipW-dependent biofilm matrix protein [Gemmiger sp.]|nr:BsaA family SipW-dependent biofilm matrix protein [Gemmiger sp.]